MKVFAYNTRLFYSRQFKLNFNCFAAILVNRSVLNSTINEDKDEDKQVNLLY